jgi:SAM-dependent methyltransferase
VNEFTGERVIPGKVEVDLWNEHVSRYAFAARYAAGRRVLDAGCGAGYGAAELSLTAANVLGIDSSQEAIVYARQHYGTGNLQFLVASAAQIPVRGQEFDLITAFELIEHLEDWRAFLCEMRRLLRPGGVFIVSTPNREYYAESRAERGPNPFHHHEFDAPEFVDELRAVFPQVRLFLQNRGEALTFYPARGFTPADARIEAGAGDASTAHFFVGLCGDSEAAVPNSFVFVPKAANVLREREHHIASLTRQLANAIDQRDALHQALKDQKQHLEEQNRWALDVERQSRSAHDRIIELQNEVQQLTVAYDNRIRELEVEVAARTQWAIDTEQRLTAEIEELKAQGGRLAAELERSESTLAERTRWALDLESRASQLEAQLNLVRASRWIRLGRQIGLGPSL